MQINVAQLLKEPIGSSRDWDIDQIDESTGYPIHGFMKLVRTDRGILVTGILENKCRVECSRCLSEIDYQASLKIEEEYFPTINVTTGAISPLPDEPGIFTINENHILDLTEAVRQYMLMAIPMKPLCRADCAGLCPECGHNLNLGPCNCTLPTLNPKWSELLKLASSK